MDSKDRDGLEPELDRAKDELAAALDEACRMDVKRANTGELIRVEEVLAIANEAAKTAVSIRRRRSRQLNEVGAGGSSSAPTPGSAEGEDPARTSAALDLEPAAGHRVFRDPSGATWEAFAVHPSADSQSRARLPDPYRSGWLAFECEREKRRLSPIPEGWASLPEAGLLELCERAERVRRRSAPAARRPAAG